MPLALLDTNVLVHAAARQSPLHPVAARLLERGLREPRVYCIAPQNLVEFAAVLTRARHLDKRVPHDEVSRFAQQLYRSRCLTKIYPKRATVARAILEGVRLGLTGSAWYDLFLAVTMRDAGVSIVITEDVADFRRFPFLKVRSLDEA